MTNIRRLQDVQIGDTDLIETYRNTFNNESIDTAHSLIDTNTLKSYVLQSEWLNDVKTKIENIEEYKFTEYDGTLDSTTQEFQFNINEFLYINEYDNDTQYYKNNFVLYDNDIYFCIKDSLSKLPTNTTYWVKIGLLGEKGQYSLGVVYRGFWEESTQYYKYDLVTYNNDLYIAKRNNIDTPPLRPQKDYYLNNELYLNNSLYLGNKNPHSKTKPNFINNFLFLNNSSYLGDLWTNDNWFLLTDSTDLLRIYDSPTDYSKLPIYSIIFQKL